MRRIKAPSTGQYRESGPAPPCHPGRETFNLPFNLFNSAHRGLLDYIGTGQLPAGMLDGPHRAFVLSSTRPSHLLARISFTLAQASVRALAFASLESGASPARMKP